MGGVTKPKKERIWTDTFERLPAEKKARILDAAKHAFATAGLAGANINKIAAAAGISVGSIYKYFRTKEDLFLVLIENYHEYIGAFIDRVLADEPTFAGRVRALLEASVRTSLEDPEAVNLYIACTTEELAALSSRLSFSIEEVSAGRYRAMVEQAKRAGEVDPALDPGWAALFLDDILLMTQYSVGSAYYRTRLRVFLGRCVKAATEPGAGPAAATPAEGDQACLEEMAPKLLALTLRALEPRRL
jgi:AcrR family transcriptional regulator